MLDENEFLSPYGLRSLSRYHAEHPYVIHACGQEYRVSYLPAESDTGMFGGNSNWRGLIWMPVNALVIRALLHYFGYYGEDFTVECPTGSGRQMNLYEVFGLGPTFVFPTATSKFAGQGAWQAGAAFAAVYTGVPRLLMGFLLQNPISFAYTSSDRPAQNTFAFQPAVLFSLWDGWYLRSADATWVYGWRRHSPSLLPLSLGVGRVMVRPGLPPLNFYVSAQWMACHQNSPITSQWGVNFGVTIAFSQFGKGE